MGRSHLIALTILLALVSTAGCAPTSPLSSVQPAAAPTTQPSPTPECTQDGLVQQARTVQTRIDSPTLGRPLQFEYYLPPDYEHQTGASYPVLYLIPGGGGTASTWTSDMHAAEIADQLIRGGQIPPFILVTTANLSDDQQGAALIDDLVPYVDDHFRTQTDRRHRAVGGFSLGGLIAYRMAFQHPDLFGSVGLFGGVVRSEEEAINAWIEATPREQWPRVLMDYGDQDPLVKKAKIMTDVLDRWGIPYTLNVGSAGHDLLYWSGHLEMYLRWYAEDW